MYKSVSVPLRGLWFLSFLIVLLIRTIGGGRFRPLAGIMVLIALKCYDIVAKIDGFPSPCGDYGSYLQPWL